jgi:HSP20 family protein
MKLLIPNRQNGYGLNPLLNLGQELDRLFDASLSGPASGGYPNSYVPALELRENKDNVYVSVELPGVDKKDVEVTLHDGVLTVSGERKQETEVKEGEYFRTERSYGRFQRQVALAQPVDADAVKAAYKDGVLTITLPKTPEAKPKPITISES